MAKTFYTERDIEDLAARGVMTLLVNDDVVLTELAREKAERLGVKLAREDKTAPTAPSAPYPSPESPSSPEKPKPAGAPAGKAELQERVRAAVVARLGSEVDPALLDTIIRRVLESV
ncbi:MAG TPA: hypothetical protein VMN57_04220 [Anaerolineales bacterium]|nr:hypothetical protein [Anaerolineales bacterium]